MALVGATGGATTTLAARMAMLAGSPAQVGPLTEMVVGDTRVALLDGASADLSAQSAVSATGCAIFVLSCDVGLDPASTELWQWCDEREVPRLIMLTDVGTGRADFDDMVAIAQRALGDTVVTRYLPLADDDDAAPAGLFDLVHERIIDYSNGQRTEREPDAEHIGLTRDSRIDLVEAVLAVTDDDSLVAGWVENQTVDANTLERELALAVSRGYLQPILPTTRANDALGVTEAIALIVSSLPGPESLPLPAVVGPRGTPAAPLECDPAGPLLAEVLCVADQGALVRVWSGVLVAADTSVEAGRLAWCQLSEARAGTVITSPDHRLSLLAEPLDDPFD